MTTYPVTMKYTYELAPGDHIVGELAPIASVGPMLKSPNIRRITLTNGVWFYSGVNALHELTNPDEMFTVVGSGVVEVEL